MKATDWIRSGGLWPVAVVVLLLGSVTLMASVIVAARSDGGAQVVENYYDQALEWDSLATIRSKTARMNLLVILSVSLDESVLSGTFTVQDSLSNRLSDLEGRIDISRPQYSTVLYSEGLRAPDQKGTYRFSVSLYDIQRQKREALDNPSGLWDFSFHLNQEATPLLFEFRKEIR